MLIVSEGGAEANERLRAELGLRSPLLLQEADEVARLFRVPYTPYVYVLDRDGVVLSHGGANTAEDLDQLLSVAERTTESRADAALRQT